MKPAATSAAGIARRLAACSARATSSPVVRKVRNVAPWNANRRTTATPAATVYGLKRSARLPAKSPSESIGTPCTRFASATPQISAAPKSRSVFAQLQTLRQPGLSLFERHSNETDTDDQEDEHEEQRDVEPGEHRRVPRWEGSERRSGGDDEPHLVAVPHRPDRLQQASRAPRPSAGRTAAASPPRSRSPRARSTRPRERR